jgi:hypothetical protein
LQERADLGDDVVIRGLDLHRARLALHVHQAQVGARPGDRLGHVRVAPQSGDVVDELGPEGERTPRHLRLCGVDRDWNAFEPLEHRDDTAQLLVERDSLRAGPRRLAADVHDRRALLQHASRRRGGDVRFKVHAAVRKRVRRHVHDAHHRRARKALVDRD